MCEQILTAYWIAHPSIGPLGFGVTAFSLNDAITMILQFGYELPEEKSSLSVTENIRYVDLDHHVQCNMGPIVVRGVWYPFFKIGPPNL